MPRSVVPPSAEVVPVDAARRLLMAGAGLLDDPGRRATASSVAALIERLGFVQVDSINVVERAHHHILWARAHGYRPPVLARLHERDRAVFEHWTHDASVIPAVWLPQWRVRWERHRASQWFTERLGPDAERVAARVLQRIADEGALPARAFEREPGNGNGAPREGGGWWNWRPSKAALEYLWRTGRLAISRREGFEKVYDLMERVHPEVLAHETPDAESHAAWACGTAMERLVIATAKEVAGFWGAIPAAEAAAWCERAVREGRLVRATLDGADVGARPVRRYALAGWRERLAALPEPPAGMRLLSPFDPVLRDRGRALRLFGFDYRFEAFVPAARRRHGYYVMPVLEGERLVARVDPKLDRRAGVLEVRGVWWEEGVRPTRARRTALDGAVGELAALAGAERWRVNGGG